MENYISNRVNLFFFIATISSKTDNDIPTQTHICHKDIGTLLNVGMCFVIENATSCIFRHVRQICECII